MKIALTDRSGAHVAHLVLSRGANVWWLEGAPGDPWWLARRTEALPDRGGFSPAAGGPEGIALHTPLFTRPILTLRGIGHAHGQLGPPQGTATLHGPDGVPGAADWRWRRTGELSPTPIRTFVINMIRRAVPRVARGYGVTSRDPKWSELTDATHAEIARHLDAGPDFTSCNTVCGGIVQKVIRRTGRRDLEGTGMTGMQINPHDITQGRKGARPAGPIFVPAGQGRLPRPGDFYSCPSRKYGTPHGHMGVVLACDGRTLLSFDPGQDVRLPPTILPDLSGGLPSFDEDGSLKTVTISNSYGQALIKSRSMAEVAPHGWLDLDAWFYGRNEPRAPFGIGELWSNSL